ncbi:endospore germination permease [Paenibacillus pasadenensis]|uniref:endospore germination permease n=1 Tax=Paenibacillus pasadenensis TaxID=217090 RepID=UPI00203DFC0F|nr:endospore germination permease [Paenibacillus pasadenensis]MCM3745782.1 endospore germination permease [Paenibacillus pasadenensis]
MEGRVMNVFQAFLILSLSNGLTSHVLTNPMLLDASGRDAWIAALTAGGLFVGWSVMIVAIMRRSGQLPWREWLAKRTHPVLSWILVAPVLLLLFITSLETVTQTVSWHVTNYLPASSTIQLAILLLVICLVLVWWGLRVLAVAAGVLLPIVAGLGIFVGTTNAPIKDMSLLLPILEHGWGPVVQGMIYAGAAYSELIIIILLQHRIKGTIKAWHAMIFAAFIVAITCGPLIGGITEFGPEEATNQMTSPYEQWRLLMIGQYIEHLDFFSIFQWLAGAAVRASLPILILADVLPFRTLKQRQLFMLFMLVCCGFASLLPLNEYEIYSFLYQYYVPIALAAVLPLSLIWFVITMAVKPERRSPADEQSQTAGQQQKGQQIAEAGNGEQQPARLGSSSTPAAGGTGGAG